MEREYLEETINAKYSEPQKHSTGSWDPRQKLFIKTYENLISCEIKIRNWNLKSSCYFRPPLNALTCSTELGSLVKI